MKVIINLTEEEIKQLESATGFSIGDKPEEAAESIHILIECCC